MTLTFRSPPGKTQGSAITLPHWVQHPWSAGSKTEPGGYYTYPQALEQFSVNDDRTPAQVEKDIHDIGYEVVWKDWDRIFD